MDCSSSDTDTLPILRLRKWGPCGLGLDLSEFREGFISPTRELLLLLSYQREAVLLPLGESTKYGMLDGCCDDGVETRTSAEPGAGDLIDGGPCISSPSGIDADDRFLDRHKFSRSNSCPFVYNVESLGWGGFSDGYDRHKDILFREFLFVSDGDCVMVHAFREPDMGAETSSPALEGGFGAGRWMEWGPRTLQSGSEDSCEEEKIDQLGKGGASRRWLRSFLTKADTIECDGKIWTRFPDKSSFPCSAMVVSFSILDSNTLSDSNGLCDKFGIGSYKCSRVFSGESHCLIGLVFTRAYALSVNTMDESEKSIVENQILVARLDSWGIQWVSNVKLVKGVHLEDWTDFCFTDNVVACLNASGFVYFYDTMSGELVAHVDVLHDCRLNSQTGMSQSKDVVVSGSESKQVEEVHDNFSSQSRNDIGRRFRRLLVAPNTSMLAVVDEFGTIYVLFAGDYLPDNYYTYGKMLPHLHHMGLGKLVSWEVGGSDVGHRRVYFTSSSAENLGFSCYYYARNYGLQLSRNKHIQGNGVPGDSSLSCFSTLSNMAACSLDYFEGYSKVVRKVFISTERSCEDQLICFSPLGISRFSRKTYGQNPRNSSITHFSLHVDSTAQDDIFLASGSHLLFPQRQQASVGEAIGCTFQGCFYLVSDAGFSVVLPSLSVSSNFLSINTIGFHQYSNNIGVGKHVKGIQEMEGLKQSFSQWKTEVLDRVLLYEGCEEADHLCLANGWDLKLPRLRMLQIALGHLKFDEIEKSLEMLVDVNLAEEGVLRLLFAAVYMMSCSDSNDGEMSAVSRLLALATWFTTKMIRYYASRKLKQGELKSRYSNAGLLSLPPVSPVQVHNEIEESRRLRDMAHFLETTRNLQYQLSMKVRKGDGGKASSLVDASQSPYFSGDAALLESLKPEEHTASILNVGSDGDNLAVIPRDSADFRTHSNPGDVHGISMLVPQDVSLLKKVSSLENPKEMIARWKIDNLDLKTVVQDALLSGRLPLAVLQLHLHQSKDLDAENESSDTFNEVRDIGRAFAYDLFLKGETVLAVATLQRLGEDIETCLKQLLLGTVRRSLRFQVAEEMRRYGFLGPHEWKILERILLIERLYPSNSFWKTFLSRQKALTRATESLNFPTEIKLQLLPSDLFSKLIIECGEIDGVVLGSWTSINENPLDPVLDEDSTKAGYWAAAAVWSRTWDQRTIDRIALDQPFLMGIHVSWESQLEYYVCHNDLEEVSKLVDLIPTPVLLDGSLQITLDSLQQAPSVGLPGEFPVYGNFICSIEELDTPCIDVPGVKVFRSSVNIFCSVWLRMNMEIELAKKFIFVREYWEGTVELVALLGCSGFITKRFNKMPLEDYSEKSLSDLNALDGLNPRADTILAFHKLLVQHCVQCNFPNLLDLYLDHHDLAMNNDSLISLLEAAGDCQWAKWLLFSRTKGHEYDLSFCNARSVMSHNAISDSNLSVPEIDEIIHTIDDIAEGGGEMAALATLMYAPSPIQNCLKTGSVNRRNNLSAQCTLENLRPTLQHFPTLWHTLVASSIGQDTLGPKVVNALSDYLNWRDNIFSASTRDTSLLQMLPCWFPKIVRRLIQLYTQGPLGWQSLSSLPTEERLLYRDIDFYLHADEHTEINAVSWEATIQKHVQEELYNSSLEETGLGLEHHLLRGRALAAFNHILSVRVQKLILEWQPGASSHGQANVQSDVQTLLAPLAQNEENHLASVIPLALTHFEDSVLVASCAFLLELCGLSDSVLRVDIAAMRRISSFYNVRENNDKYGQFSPKASVFHAVSLEGDVVESLARSLADEYMHKGCLSDSKVKGTSNSLTSRRASRALLQVLQHLEKASLPRMANGKTSGSWLLTGSGDGIELRSQQKAASQHWNLVTVFCQMHQLPLSTKYLALLARDNDWVGFLSEAQIGGYPFDTVVNTASKEFSDLRLRTHILTVLKGMQTKKKIASATYSETLEKETDITFSHENVLISVELFEILAQCEKKKNPGKILLRKAKEMSWSVLAMVASCFPDVSPLSCLTVWLEITAARETSSIKVNDIASQIADGVQAAVEATNSLPVASRSVTFHYNRQNLKRRRLIEPIPLDSSAVNAAVSSSYGGEKRVISEGTSAGESKLEVDEQIVVSNDSDEVLECLSRMVAVLCEQHLFLPLLRAFEMFLPSCSLLPFIRALQAFSQMRLSEGSAHLDSFSARIKDEPSGVESTNGREGLMGVSWIRPTAVKAANAVLSSCPSPYERRCLLQLLASTDFGDGGAAATCFFRNVWKINLAEPSLRKDDVLHLGNETLDDASLLTALEKNGHWDQARNWARQLEASGGPWKSAGHHVTETQAESMVAEWKEFLWDVPEERVALWGHCQTLFIRYSFPPLQAGLFFLKHAQAVEKDLPARELHELLLLSLQWLSGMITLSHPVYPIHILREIETRVWLLAVESEAQVKSDSDYAAASSSRDTVTGSTSNIIERTATLISKMDNHINSKKNRTAEKPDMRESSTALNKNQVLDTNNPTAGWDTKTKRRAKGYMPARRPLMETIYKTADPEDGPNSRDDMQLQDGNTKLEMSLSKWEERVGPAELERAVLSLLEFGQISAAKQLQHKLSPTHTPSEFRLVDAALKLAAISTPNTKIFLSLIDGEVLSIIQSYNISTNQHVIDPIQVLESLATIFMEGGGRGLCKRIIAVVKAANVLGILFSEAFDKQPIDLLRLLALKAQESFEEASLLVKTHSMQASSIAQILAESFLKGLLAAHRGGYMDLQKEEGPAPLLWRFSDFLKWAQLCPSEPEIGHALMRLVITRQEIPHACEVELLILSHHFYKSSACLDGVDVLVALAANRVEAYVSEGDFPCLARLVTGVGNFHALNFILSILIENGQLDLLLQKYSAAADTSAGTAEAVRGFRMAVLTSLKHFNPKDLDAFAMVYTHFDMKHETAALLESRAWQSSEQWLHRYNKDQNEDLLESMRYFIEAAEVYSSIDAGNKTRRACGQASLVSLQIRMSDGRWLYLSETNARRQFVDQFRFQEALIVAEAYGLNQPSEWALVLWNLMLRPDLIEDFVAEFVAVLPLQPSMLTELARFYRAEVAARGDQSQFSVWLTGGGLPADWAKHLSRSFRCLLKRTRDLRLRMQLATVATGFTDVIDACAKALDKVPENAGPLVLRKGHGGGYLPLM